MERNEKICDAGVKKIRLLKVDFDHGLPARQIPLFRGAVVAKVGRESSLFHNHQEEGFRYRYPFIQYKTIGGKLSIVCVEDGVDEIFKLFSSADWNLQLGEESVNLTIEHLSVNHFNLQVWNHSFKYRMLNWLALNQENYAKYRDCDSLVQKITLLEGVLKANILAFAKGIGWYVDKPFDVAISHLEEPKVLLFKGQKLMAFNLEFSTNVFIPNYIGLGKGVSHGFGNVLQLKNNNK